MPMNRQGGTRPPSPPHGKPSSDSLLVDLYGSPAMKGRDGSVNPSFTMFIKAVDDYGNVLGEKLTMVVFSSQPPDKLQFEPQQCLLTHKRIFEQPNLYMSMWVRGALPRAFHTDYDPRLKIPKGFHLDVRKMRNDTHAWLEVSLWRTNVDDLDTDCEPAQGSHRVYEQQHYGTSVAPDCFFRVYNDVVQLLETKWWKQQK